MSKTLLSRIKRIEQYNKENHTILWKDDTINRWQNVYNKLEINDNVIFISVDESQLLIGAVIQIDNKRSIKCNNIQEISCSNDQLLQLHQSYPELIPRVKANFPPFIHPRELDISKLITDAQNKLFTSFYIVSGLDKYNELLSTFRINDRIILIKPNGKFDNVKLHASNGLVDFPTNMNIHIRVENLTLEDILNKNKKAKSGSPKSNNVTRVQKIISDIKSNGYYKFNSFYSYHDTLYNKRLYGDYIFSTNSIKTISLKGDETVYKISMSPKDIDQNAFKYFRENNLLVVHSKTKAKGISSQKQGDTFVKQMNIGDYFYLCRGNDNLEVIGKITGDSVECKYKEWGDKGWMQRSFEVMAESINKDPYLDEKKWWTPNDNSTCIAIPRDNIEMANNRIFKPFFELEFEDMGRISLTKNELSRMKDTLNIILYGPPGTGKTYKLYHTYIPLFIKSEKIVQQEKKKGDNNYKFVTFHQSFTYEDFIEGIKPKLYHENNEVSEINYHIEDGVFYKCCDEAAKLAGFNNLRDCIEEFTIEQRIAKFSIAPPYAIFIDEINRGNISAIMGELITLIEEDKRLTKNELIVELPYSKRKFGVPPNIYIIGTMNTADRSVEALDTALRRRFSFEEMAPDSKLIASEGMLRESEGVLDDINLPQLLDIINERIEILLDKDHKIGHSYFMKVSTIEDLQSVFHHKIIPLLQEYFYGDYGKVGMIMGEGFVRLKEKKSNTLFAKIYDYETSEYEEKATYRFHDLSSMPSEEFRKAINTLLLK